MQTDIAIALQHKIGRFVRVELTYHTYRLQISEITFISEPIELANNTELQWVSLFERVNSVTFNDDASVSTGGGTRYIMPEDTNSLFGGGMPSPSKYSIVIILVCILGNHRRASTFSDQLGFVALNIDAANKGTYLSVRWPASWRTATWHTSIINAFGSALSLLVTMSIYRPKQV